MAEMMRNPMIQRMMQDMMQDPNMINQVRRSPVLSYHAMSTHALMFVMSVCVNHFVRMCVSVCLR